MNNHLNIPVSVAEAELPQRYIAAKNALADCQDIDECKTWADKAQAIASYARQADDDTLLKMVTRIQARAVRRCGELLKHFQTAENGGRPSSKNGAPGYPVSQRQMAEDAGLSKHQEKQARRLANIPEPQFDAAVESDQPPSIKELAKIGTQSRPLGEFEPPVGFKQATHLLGAVHRFADFCASHDPAHVAHGVMSHEAASLHERIAIIDQWLDVFMANLKE